MLKTIRNIAKQKGIPLAKIERACELGERSLYRWDTNYPSVDKVKKVADYLGVTVDDLLKEEEENDTGRNQDE